MNNLLSHRISRMTHEQLLDGIYRDQLTGTWNRRALEDTVDTKFVAMLDLDSLKWINDNHGHAAGDRAIQKMATALNKAFPGRVFRISGDEFVVRSNDRDELNRKLSRGTCFSYGIGTTLEQADQNLNTAKHERTVNGQRSNRGEVPIYVQRRRTTR